MLSFTKKSELFARANVFVFLSVSVDNNCQVYCKVFCIWRYVNHVAHPVLNWIYRLCESCCYILLFWALFFFFRRPRFFLCSELSVSTGHNHSISRRRPRKFNICYFFASVQAFIAKAVIACKQWYPYIERHGTKLFVLLTHVWKPAFKKPERKYSHIDFLHNNETLV